jgi:predicted lipoprotein with Yx(FWY)xxD motif
LVRPELRPILIVLALVLVVAGCGGEDDSAQPQQGTTRTATDSMTKDDDAMKKDDDGMKKDDDGMKKDGDAMMDKAASRRPAGEAGLRVPAKQAQIVVKNSEFGKVLFDANGQVVYVFEIDGRNRSGCTSAECVKAWPPVLTREKPSAGAGADESLLGTIRRSDGMLQVTYNGRPLYFYEHEAPGEIKCHNVDLHGGLWWVVTPRGEPVS